MLVLSRKKQEQIVIDENVVITVVDIKSTNVRLGIEAPREIPVHRKEVHEAMQRDQVTGQQVTGQQVTGQQVTGQQVAGQPESA